MKMIKVKYFAFIKDITGKDEETLDLNCNTVDCIIKFLSEKYGRKMEEILKNGINGVKVTILVNGKISHTVADGDEVAIFPPPAGGELVKSKFDLLEEIRKFRENAPPEAGSLVVYLGFVKGIVDGHRVYELRYEAYEDYTIRRLKEIEDELMKKYHDLVKIKIIHVISNMKPGDDVLLIMCMGRGRKDSIKAVEEAVELVKNTTGIWKLEIRDDGEFWVVAGTTRVKRIND
ncbi:MoaD family protein [Acidianus ambivalens]|uniref:MoaD family protein n=1 Tax=Acidianus ambivalens TaxID=2283 RepID=A0A650CUN4_ACIAM|nr:MoaD family protein [Acidianus ambivalens]MQL55854.1 MoaD family protein [Acidianus ambivalens]QGR21581.1 MoaD family protein [Acidianus ambivalens]